MLLRFDIANIAGSIRRKSESVGDIDIVVATPKTHVLDPTLEAILAVGFISAHRDSERDTRTRRESFTIEPAPGRMMHVDVWLASQEIMGAAMLHCTGSLTYNVICRRLAKHRGLSLSVRGLVRCSDGERLESRTEEGVMATMGLPFVRPEERGCGPHGLNVPPALAKAFSEL